MPRTPTPVPTAISTPAPALESLEIYARGEFQNGYGTLSWVSPSPDPSFDGRQYLDGQTLFKNLKLANGTGDFMSVFNPGDIDLAPFTHVRFVITSLSATGSWLSVSLATVPWEPGNGSSQVYVPASGWYTISVPIEEMDTFDTESGIRGIGFRGESGPNASNTENPIAFGEISLVRTEDLVAPRVISVSDTSESVLSVEFSEPITSVNSSSFLLTSATDPSYFNASQPRVVDTFESGRFARLTFETPLLPNIDYMLSVRGLSDAAGNGMTASKHDIRPVIKQATLSVDYTQDIGPITSKIRGMTMQTTSWIWGDIAAADSIRRAALIEATSRIKPGVIRFAGGLWANSTGWDRAGTAPEDGDWVYADMDTGEVFEYGHAYKPSMIDSYAGFAAELGAETIMQINICDNNTAMWADLVRYTNIEHDYAFRYWELGDRIDEEECLNAFEYAERFGVYATALREVDPSIRVIGPSATDPDKTQWIDALMSMHGTDLDVLSFQWHQLNAWTTNTSSFEFEIGSPDALLNYNSAVGYGCWVGWGCGTETVKDDDLTRMRYRRGIAESMRTEVLDRFERSNPGGEIAITEFGPIARQPSNPLNGSHLSAIWLADMLGRWAYNGLDILTYNGLESGGTGKGPSTGVLGIDDSDTFDVRPTYFTQWLYAQHFGDVMVQSSTSDALQEVVVWASRDSDNPRILELMLLNLGAERATVQLQIEGFVASSGEAYVLSSNTPTSVSNPAAFADHQTSINGVILPDITVASPNEFTEAIDSISPIDFATGPETSYELPPYSVIALTLRR